MRGITFDHMPFLGRPNTDRMDVACFIGFAPVRQKPLVTETVKQWLREYGWDETRINEAEKNHASMRNTPIPLESWEAFQAVFSDTRLDRIGTLRGRPISDPLTLAEKDARLHVVIDRRPTSVKLAPKPDNTIGFRDLE